MANNILKTIRTLILNSQRDGVASCNLELDIQYGLEMEGMLV